MDRIKVLMFGHGGYDNHGCEAIVRSTSRLLKEYSENYKIKVASYRYEEDVKFIVNEVDEYIPHETPVNKYTWKWIRSLFFHRITRDYEASLSLSQSEVIKEVSKSDICLSIGGDNYCYGDPTYLFAIDRKVKRAGKKLVLWGASIEPVCVNERMIKDLMQFDALFARESITYNTLRKLNINRKVYLYPDPAFTMEKEDLPLPEGWVEGKMVGINLSPLIMEYEKNNGMVLAAFNTLIEFIISKTDLNVILISHVVLENNNDYEVLSKIFEKFKDSKRVILLDTNYTAPQLKGFISRCRFFIGARTHATIAAYSTCVPTLVIGYSVKARGIARDIFGDEAGYVIPVQNIADSFQIQEGFKSLIRKEAKIREHLIKFMPGYIERARNSVDKLGEIVKDKK